MRCGRSPVVLRSCLTLRDRHPTAPLSAVPMTALCSQCDAERGQALEGQRPISPAYGHLFATLRGQMTSPRSVAWAGRPSPGASVSPRSCGATAGEGERHDADAEQREAAGRQRAGARAARLGQRARDRGAPSRPTSPRSTSWSWRRLSTSPGPSVVTCSGTVVTGMVVVVSVQLHSSTRVLSSSTRPVRAPTPTIRTFTRPESGGIEQDIARPPGWTFDATRLTPRR